VRKGGDIKSKAREEGGGSSVGKGGQSKGRENEMEGVGEGASGGVVGVAGVGGGGGGGVGWARGGSG